jgi:hypothetical protein
LEKWIVARAMKAATMRARTTVRIGGILARLRFHQSRVSSRSKSSRKRPRNGGKIAASCLAGSS